MEMVKWREAEENVKRPGRAVIWALWKKWDEGMERVR